MVGAGSAGVSFLLGVDTGGTYTDAALMDATTREVLATAKALTTKGNLAVGVTEAIAAVMNRLPNGAGVGDVGLVSVSTTLATNAVVEGHGDTVGVLLIGFDGDMAARTGIAAGFPDLPIAQVDGGHDHSGAQRAELDEAALLSAVDAMAGKVTAFAVSATFAVRNPSHEQRARALIESRTDKPVTMSTEISSALDAPRRALTATLNARLIGRITTLIHAVERSMAELGLRCPLMLVKGDGSLALASSVVRRPIETVLSGPAASMVGARVLSHRDDFVMSDMGGTTTDVGVMVAGRPVLNPAGSEIGGWRTMVTAIDVRTIGLGGDSEVIVRDGKVRLGTTRTVPLSLLAARYPQVITALHDDLADTRHGSALHGKFAVTPFGADPAAVLAELDPRDADVYRLLLDGPRPLREAEHSTAARRALERMRRKGLVVLAGFTPSDAAHVLDLQHTWSTEAALLGARLGARLLSMKFPNEERTTAFAREVWHQTVTQSARAVIDAAAAADGGQRGGTADRALTSADSALLDLVCAGNGRIGALHLTARPAVPVVAVGGPVTVFYPAVGERLGCEVVFPSNCEVANAVGAAAGVVTRVVVVTVESNPGGGGYTVHSDQGVTQHAAALEALDIAEQVAERLAADAVRAMGATTSDVATHRSLIMIPGMENDDGLHGLISATVTAEAVGRPDI